MDTLQKKDKDLVTLAQKVIIDKKPEDGMLMLLDMIHELQDSLEAIKEQQSKDIEGIKTDMPDLNKVLASVRGTPGIDGVNGMDGADSDVEGPQGEPGRDGIDGKPGKDGKSGKDGVRGPQGEPGLQGTDGKDGSPDTPIEVRDKLESLVEDERLDISAVQGFEEIVKDLRSSNKKITIPGWGAHPLKLLNSTGTVVDKVARVIKFSTNLTATRGADGVVTVTASGGSGFTTLTAAETPNSNIKVFTFAAAAVQPSFIIADGVWMQATDQGSVINWTWNSGTKKATFTIPPTSGILGVV